VIADLDKSSKTKLDGKNEVFMSKYMTGTLSRSGESYSIEWDAPADVYTSHNEAGRGCELSELVRYNGKLYSFDDRTGIMFEIVNPQDSSIQGEHRPILVPRQIFMEGDGTTDKGLKVEWATVRDNQLYVGSFGKEFTSKDGKILHSNNLWVVVLQKDGSLVHVDFSEYYNKLRSTFGYSHPGYMIHESITWSPYHKKWFILPRRVSNEPYDDEKDEKRGSNIIITANSDFSQIIKYEVGKVTPERGFSSAKFLPGSKDSVIVALKSEENSEKGSQSTYITIYGESTSSTGVSEWKVLMDEIEVPGGFKFEGLEIIS